MRLIYIKKYEFKFYVKTLLIVSVNFHNKDDREMYLNSNESLEFNFYNYFFNIERV